MTVYPVELLAKFVDEWKAFARKGGHYDDYVKSYPQDISNTWLDIVRDETGTFYDWEDCKLELIRRLYTKRTKLGQIL